MLPAYTTLRMVTLNGGRGTRALGIDAETGSFEIGKSVDMVAFDLWDPKPKHPTRLQSGLPGRLCGCTRPSPTGL